MKELVILNVVLLSVIGNINCVKLNVYGDIKSKHPEDPGEPLFLTPLIESGRIEEAQKLSSVPSFAGNVTSHAGYVTVNKKYDSNLFFWFFKSEKDWKNAPIAVWLQGGPGYSSLFGLFNENGPYVILNKNKLKLRKYSWHIYCNMIFIDSPVGTGYSFTKSDEGYARNQSDVGKDLFAAMVQILKLFPEIKNNPFFITGESYAGKYIPALGYAIHKYNPSSDVKVNLHGLFIGNGLTDPENMIPMYAETLYSLGFIDYNEKKEFHQRQEEIVHAIRNRDWDKATLLYTQLIIGYSFFPYPTLYSNVTGISNYYNYIFGSTAEWKDYESDFVLSNYFRKSVHVGKIKRDDGSKTESLFKSDIAKSVIHMVKELVEHYRVQFYNGQLDVICAYPLTENFLRKMEWSGANEYRRKRRKIWKIGGEVAGYVKTHGRLSEVLVRNAGHMVPTDQPKWAFELFNKFIYNVTL